MVDQSFKLKNTKGRQFFQQPLKIEFERHVNWALISDFCAFRHCTLPFNRKPWLDKQNYALC